MATGSGGMFSRGTARIGNLLVRRNIQFEKNAGWNGLGMKQLAVATFDPSAIAAQRTVGAHGLGVTIPDNAIIVGGFYEVLTTFITAAADAGTIALMAQAANDLVVAITVANVANAWDAGLHAIVPKENTPETTGIKLSAARELTATVAIQALTAGKLALYVVYVEGY